MTIQCTRGHPSPQFTLSLTTRRTRIAENPLSHKCCRYQTQSRLARLSALARRNNALSPSRTPAVPPATPSGNTTDKLLHNLHSSANHISHVPSTPASSSASGVFQTPAPKSTPAAKVVSATFSSSSSMANRSALRQKYASPSLRSLTAFGSSTPPPPPRLLFCALL